MFINNFACFSIVEDKDYYIVEYPEVDIDGLMVRERRSKEEY